MKNTKRPYIVSIEGNIGSGKTTLINCLEEHYGSLLENNKKNYIFLREPLDIWNSVQDEETGENMIQKFYKDPTKYAMSFQIMAYITFHQRLENAIKNSDDNTVIVCERSLESCRSIFSKLLKENGNIDNVNYQILEMFYNKTELIPVDAIIYLDPTLEISIDRIAKRGRLGENNITTEYLEKCRKSHCDWIHSITSNQLDNPKPVLILDELLSDVDIMVSIDKFITNNCYKLVGLCEGCNIENKIYSDEKYYKLTNYDLKKEKLLCKKCFDDCWRYALDDGWRWEDDILYTGEEYETDSI